MIKTHDGPTTVTHQQSPIVLTNKDEIHLTDIKCRSIHNIFINWVLTPREGGRQNGATCQFKIPWNVKGKYAAPRISKKYKEKTESERKGGQISRNVQMYHRFARKRILVPKRRKGPFWNVLTAPFPFSFSSTITVFSYYSLRFLISYYFIHVGFEWFH